APDLLADQVDLAREDVKTWDPKPGGAPCNVAAALAKLGVDVAFVSAIGMDGRGDELLHLLKGIVQLQDARLVKCTQRDTVELCLQLNKHSYQLGFFWLLLLSNSGLFSCRSWCESMWYSTPT
ncbi:MAG: PfkB family carbohydrate kinase, partial [Cytophagales bacterium]|nr:PfkB family carbohydrate kinase [Cytophagales bacterium]